MQSFGTCTSQIQRSLRISDILENVSSLKAVQALFVKNVTFRWEWFCPGIRPFGRDPGGGGLNRGSRTGCARSGTTIDGFLEGTVTMSCFLSGILGFRFPFLSAFLSLRNLVRNSLFRLGDSGLLLQNSTERSMRPQ